jgi:hypothetical protein
MVEADISLFAELLQSQFGHNAAIEAQRRANHFQRLGDHKNARAWRLIQQHVHAMKQATPERQMA